MVLAAITTAAFVLVNLFGFLWSVRLERHGVPEAQRAQTAPRRDGDLRRRLPLIAVNAVGLTVGSFLGMWAASGLFTTEGPGWLGGLAQFAILLVVDDAVFYAVHRLMHEVPWLYRTLHAQHHRAYAPVPIEILFTHPAETALVTLGMGGGVLVVLALWGAVGFVPFLAYVVFRHLHELDVHSGVRSDLARFVPFLAVNEHHDLHHHRPGLGNYASMLTVWDRLLGTYAEDRRRSGAALAPLRVRGDRRPGTRTATVRRWSWSLDPRGS